MRPARPGKTETGLSLSDITSLGFHNLIVR